MNCTACCETYSIRQSIKLITSTYNNNNQSLVDGKRMIVIDTQYSKASEFDFTFCHQS
jgi:hypothetical protein